jgi:hypothetical protein
MKLVLNKNWGGFKIPEKLAEELEVNIYDDIDRKDSRLIAAVESGDNNDGDLVVVEIPDGSMFEILEYDGYERVVYSDTPIYFG